MVGSPLYRGTCPSLSLFLSLSSLPFIEIRPSPRCSLLINWFWSSIFWNFRMFKTRYKYWKGQKFRRSLITSISQSTLPPLPKRALLSGFKLRGISHLCTLVKHSSYIFTTKICHDLMTSSVPHTELCILNVSALNSKVEFLININYIQVI